eukprot:CAMPEP_0174290080 /NCGR_PEP_ID=MMETSP0809-20121228/27491_1 /TAXON_ID=73025 ORGANISM="Eutreptiella gymnastica-like, Strain CCMP1594" /NCGR_SAMPLE_ID=MMETSP0809 /ASSEMBLY_ACC=CAM_ASM_000658 /LENGTH=222 /DNA_ID=CAMNT_0015388477 /DNA_START=22 /DNA_END=690 /DNA_ORIENTATION=+
MSQVTCFTRAVLALLLLLPTASLAKPGKKTGPYFSVRRDYRRCISPLCGGYWVSQVNKEATVCADGAKAPECYVAEFDWRGTDQTGAGDAALVQGRIAKKQYEVHGMLGVFKVTGGAWRGAATSGTAGTYYEATDDGIRCVIAPCFSMDVEELNTAVTTAGPVSGVDLNSVEGATERDRELAWDLFQGRDGHMLVAGAVKKGLDNGKTLAATDFFLPTAAPK